MQSTLEECLLILKKWNRESTKVLVSASFKLSPDFASATIVEGAISVEESTSTIRVLSDGGAVFMATFAGVGYGYALPSDIATEDLLAVVDNVEEVEDIVIIKHSQSNIICLYSFKQTLG